MRNVPLYFCVFFFVFLLSPHRLLSVRVVSIVGFLFCFFVSLLPDFAFVFFCFVDSGDEIDSIDDVAIAASLVNAADEVVVPQGDVEVRAEDDVLAEEAVVEADADEAEEAGLEIVLAESLPSFVQSALATRRSSRGSARLNYAAMQVGDVSE